MRALGIFILGILVAVAIVVLVVFATENTRIEQLSFLGNSFRADLWLVAVIPAVGGFVLALLLTTPARTALDAERRALSQRYRDLDREYASLHQQHDALVSQHAALQAERDALHDDRARLLNAQQAQQAEDKRLSTEHDDLRSRTAASSASSPTPQPESRPVPARDGEPMRERERERAVEQVDERAPEPAVERVDGRPREPVDEREVAHESAPDQAPEQAGEPEQRPTLGERVRGWLHGPDQPQEDSQNGPLAPTA